MRRSRRKDDVQYAGFEVRPPLDQAKRELQIQKAYWKREFTSVPVDPEIRSPPAIKRRRISESAH
jgi:hypothetical protein